MKKLDYKKMIREIDDMVDSDFCFEMVDVKGSNLSAKYSQSEARDMASLLGKIYSVAHCIDCTACQGKYAVKASSEVNGLHRRKE